MRNGGFILLVLGAVVLFFFGAPRRTSPEVEDAGSAFTVTETEKISYPSVAGVVLLLAGIGLLAFEARKPSTR